MSYDGLAHQEGHEQARCNWMTCFIGNRTESIRHQVQSTSHNQSTGAS